MKLQEELSAFGIGNNPSYNALATGSHPITHGFPIFKKKIIFEDQRDPTTHESTILRHYNALYTKNTSISTR
jgi:hypothetical protein